MYDCAWGMLQMFMTTSNSMNTSLTLCGYNILFLKGILWKRHVKSSPCIHRQPHITSDIPKHSRGCTTWPNEQCEWQNPSTWSLLMISFLGLVCVVLKCLKELQQHGLLVATHFISTYVQYRHTMKKACEKISTYLHTMYIPQSLVIKHAC